MLWKSYAFWILAILALLAVSAGAGSFWGLIYASALTLVGVCCFLLVRALDRVSDIDKDENET